MIIYTLMEYFKMLQFNIKQLHDELLIALIFIMIFYFFISSSSKQLNLKDLQLILTLII
jgi:hypothetical protein